MNTESSHPFDLLTPDYMLDAVDAAGFLSDGRLLQLNSFENRVYQVPGRRPAGDREVLPTAPLER